VGVSCNCAGDRSVVSRLVLDLPARRVLCGACPMRQGNECRATTPAVPARIYVHGAPCPQARHPDRRGRVRWLGLVWMGVPAPRRWWLHARGRLSHPDALPGCGCIWLLKIYLPSRLPWWVRAGA
jgi:hypothetical protein